MGSCCSNSSPDKPSPCHDWRMIRDGDEGFYVCKGTDCQMQKRNVNLWGTGPNTLNSCACLAAQHAGVIPEGGGLFKVTAAPGQDSYGGSTENGVTSSSYGSYHASMIITKM